MKNKKTKKKLNGDPAILRFIPQRFRENKALQVVLTLIVFGAVWLYCRVASICMILGLIVTAYYAWAVLFAGQEFKLLDCAVCIGIFVIGLVMARVYSKNILDVVMGSYPSNV